MMNVKATTVGNSAGVIMPKEVLAKLGLDIQGEKTGLHGALHNLSYHGNGLILSAMIGFIQPNDIIRNRSLRP